MSRRPRLDSNIMVDRLTTLTWADRVTRPPILSTMTSMARLPRVVTLTGLTSMHRLTIVARAISTTRLTGKDTKEGLYILTGMASHSRLTRMITPTMRHLFIRG